MEPASKPPAGPIKTGWWAPPPDFLDSVGLEWSHKFAFLTSSQVVVMVAGCGPGFENHCIRVKKKMEKRGWTLGVFWH